MSTQAVSSSSIYQELQSFYQTRQSDLQSLGSALKSGDLSTAQQAYSQLVSLGQSGPFSSSDPFSRSDRESDFQAIGQALSSGDLASAQSAFATLQQTFGSSATSDPAKRAPAYLLHLSSGASTAASTSSGTSTSGTTASTGTSLRTTVSTDTGSSTGSSGSSGSESIYQQLQAFRSERASDIQQLGQALTAGDLKTAQQDYNNIVQLGQQGPFSTAQPFQRADREQDFQAIGQALQSGSLTSAQQAFGQLESTFGKASTSGGGATSPTGSSGTSGTSETPIAEVIINIGGSGSSSTSSTTSGANGPELVLNLPSPSAGSPEEVQINFGGSNGSSDQLTIQVGQTQGQNGAIGEQISINLQQASNNESIVLNLFGAGSSQISQAQGGTLNVQG